ncbi:FtsH protease activity modulator HflK [Thalassotalea agarivorans]|uniref:Protein HflK n=1 Tax=Thalassotalea agarivorans TaxID=349064 RepID=A0A1I0CGN2_THASX|nr:FtsH protease activity modulator HflK [Thalassotalea agarivorans]SET18757.1 protease FtsH subunit HflK [Thalassotalea agarivorans]
MAWNEPGKDDKDPWKNKGGNNQGPPDLDEFFKDLGNKMGGVFGGGGKSSGSSSGGIGGFALMLPLFIALVAYLFSCIYTVKEAERAIKLRFGEYVGVVEPGLSWKWTFVEEVIPIDVQTTRALNASGFMLTQDENVVLVEMQVQYRVENARNYVFSVTNADNSLEQALDSALRYVIGHSDMDDILTSGREDVRQKVWSELEKIIAPYDMGMIIVDVNFKDARPPEAVKDAFDDAIAAQEDEVRYIREAEAYARSVEPIARGQVKRMEQEASAYKEQTVLNAQGEVARFVKLLPEYQAAPEVTRNRIYLSTMEKIYGNTSKVMVDVEGGNNMMYLPLDRILGAQPNTTISIPPIKQSGSNTPVSQPSMPSSLGRNDRFNNGRN